MIKFRAERDDLMPVYQTSQSTGCDIKAKEHVDFRPGQTLAVKTGLYLDQNEFSRTQFNGANLDVQIRLRSSLALRGFSQPNAPATIDLDYDKEICVIMRNNSDMYVSIMEGERIAQIVIGLHVRAANCHVVSRPRDGGFGSTGS